MHTTIAQFIAQQQAKVDKRYLSAWGEVVPSGKGFIWRWHRSGLPGMLAVLYPCQAVSVSAVLVRAVLSTIIGEGDMSKFARFAPPPLKNARFARKKTKKTKPTQKDAST